MSRCGELAATIGRASYRGPRRGKTAGFAGWRAPRTCRNRRRNDQSTSSRNLLQKRSSEGRSLRSPSTYRNRVSRTRDAGLPPSRTGLRPSNPTQLQEACRNRFLSLCRTGCWPPIEKFSTVSTGCPRGRAANAASKPGWPSSQSQAVTVWERWKTPRLRLTLRVRALDSCGLAEKGGSLALKAIRTFRRPKPSFMLS